MSGLPAYPDCAHIRRLAPVLSVNEQIATSIGKDYRVLPIYEKSIYEYSYKRYYSLCSNEFLKCRWKSYVRHFEERTIAPFAFIDIRDFHFYNNLNRLVPSQTVHKKKEFRYKLKVGPGVDFCGQMPIPQDLLMKRGIQKPLPKPRRFEKSENNTESDILNTKKEIIKNKVKKAI